MGVKPDILPFDGETEPVGRLEHVTRPVIIRAMVPKKQRMIIQKIDIEPGGVRETVADKVIHNMVIYPRKGTADIPIAEITFIIGKQYKLFSIFSSKSHREHLLKKL